jgi:hypothetical protein
MYVRRTTPEISLAVMPYSKATRISGLMSAEKTFSTASLGDPATKTPRSPRSSFDITVGGSTTYVNVAKAKLPKEFPQKVNPVNQNNELCGVIPTKVGGRGVENDFYLV